jgi:hypothetical protein
VKNNNSEEPQTIQLVPPSFIGVAGASPTSGVISTSGASFLEEEAGVCAYTKLDTPINLSIVKTAFRTIEYECDDYIIGSVAVSNDESEDVHVYVSKDGWLVAYYLKEEPFPKILKTLMNFDDNKLTDALKKICDTLWVTLPPVNYYDFRNPNANRVLIIADESYNYDDTFRFLIPEEVAPNVSEMYWVVIGHNGWAYLYLDNKELGHACCGKAFGTLKFAAPGVPGDIIPGEYHTVKLDVYGGVHGEGGIVIIYKE